MNGKTVVVATAAFALGGLVAVYGLTARSLHFGPTAAASGPVWAEVQWPFPGDQWGKGKAFRCDAAHCGADVDVYIRAKFGFCNCTTGVSDDEELERISDFDLFSDRFSAKGPGRPISVAWMKGRSRTFTSGSLLRPSRMIVSIGFNDRCDAIVATAATAGEPPQTIESTVIEFLNSKTVLSWAETTLGL